MPPQTSTAPDPQPASAPTRPPAGVATHPRQTPLRICLGGSAAASAACALLLLALTGATLPPLLFAALALAAVAALRAPAEHHATALTALFAGATAAIAASVLLQGLGLWSPALSAGGIMVCLLCAVAGWRAGALLAAAAGAAVVAVAWLGGAAPAGAPPSATALLLASHGLFIAIGLAGGVLIAQMLARQDRRMHDREQSLRHLLALAADGYWELDGACRLVAASGRRGGLRSLDLSAGVGPLPWDMPQFDCDAEVLDALRADLDARRPLRELPLRWKSRGGRHRSLLASGEPRFDSRGVFVGYWGVTRDITAEQEANRALAATESRYRELFSLIPTPLLLHRRGTVIDANAAAVTLFGHADTAAMLGSDLYADFEPGDSRERARRRLEQLETEPLGTALPVTGFRLQVRGRPVSVRATSVMLDLDEGPAQLSIFIDDTERLAADEALRRSEALLSHLVATSPDLITLTDLASGRYAMVNHSFERMSGYSPAEAIGRTSLELGIWATAAEREHFVALVREHGSVADLPVGFVTRTGKTVPLVVSAARFVMDRREYLVINARDVTERERQRLEREAILTNASIGIAVTRGRCFVLANPHFEQIFGWPEGALIGQPGLAVWHSERDYAEVGALVGQPLARGEVVEFERPARRRDGSSFLARIRARAIAPEQPLSSGTVWIVEDVTQRAEFEQKLARARDEAEAANRAKSAFLANTSHELRTPLNGMIGLARMARDEGLDEARRRRYLDQIVESAQSLAGIISDILDLSKIEAGKLQIDATAFDLGALLQTLHSTYATLADAHGLALVFDATPAVEGTVVGDPLRVRQILSNFLTNAIKFTPSGWVRLGAARADGGERVRLEVRDSGPGIAPEVRERLFRPFTQADQSTTRRFGGTGLGLSICREMAELMGGRVGVDSEPGAGSCFWAELPLPAATASALLAAPDAVAAPPPPADGGGLRGLSVLMVEDNPVNMMIAVAMLERWGVQVAQAEDGREALAAVQQAAAAGRPFDAVLMDVQMPVLSGHDATRALRAAGHRLPVIALTAAALVTERAAALQAGMNDFLTKPIDADRLHATLLRWTRGGAASTAPASRAATPAPAAGS